MMLFLVIVSTTTVSAEELVKPQNAAYTVAIIPYINSTEETAGYVKDIVNGKYTQQYSNGDFKMVALADVQKALNSAGYDASNSELADAAVLSTVAKLTHADYVIAMEISQLITTRHMSFFQAKVVSKAKLRYKFYNAQTNKALSFQVTGASENKTIIGDVGYRDPITKALNQAMDEANVKIKSSL